MKKAVTFLAAAVAMFSMASCSGNRSIDGHWDFKTLNGEEVVTTEKTPFLEFDGESGRVHGCLGVNIVNGSYTFEDGKLTLGNLGMTMMAGLPEDMAVESALGDALKLARGAKVSSDKLSITDAEGEVILTLERSQEQQ